MPLTIAVVNSKGGAGKTTTAGFVAHVLHARGLGVLAVDTDPQRSLATWHALAVFPFTVVEIATVRVHREVAGMVSQWDAVVIDTPPRLDGRAITRSALIAATHVIVPIAPTGMEVHELAVVRAMIEEATDLRPDGRPPVVGLLFVRTVAGAGSTAGFRAGAVTDGWPVLRGEVRRLERFAQAMPHPVVNATETGYGDAVAELLTKDHP